MRLEIDWDQLELEPGQAMLSAPEIEDFQEARNFKIGEPIPVEARKGWLLYLEAI